MLVLLQYLPEMAQASNTPEVQEVTQAIQGILKTLTKKEDAGEAFEKRKKTNKLVGIKS
jgi:hypothetical protein